MATPGFGFSAGDFIAAIQLVTKVAKALKDTGGAADDCGLALQELQHLQLVLEQLECMPASGFQSQNHLNAVKAMALTIRLPLTDFLGKLEKFQLLRDKTREGGMKMRKTKLKVQWATMMQAEVVKMRAVLTMKIVTISVLLTLPTSAMLNQLNGKLSQTEGLMNDLSHTVRKSIYDISSKQDDLQTSVSATTLAIRLDNSRLLMVCAGLRTGVSRLEKRCTILQRNTIKNRQVICQIQNSQIEVQSSLRSTELAVKHTRLIVGQLLTNFAKFSSEVLRYLRALHQSNMEIYLLLARLTNLSPQSPTNCLEDNIIFIDALQRRHSLQYAYFSEWDIFESMLRCKFKDFPAYESVMRGDYVIMDTRRSGRIVLKSAWRRSVFPGSVLDMSVIIELLGASKARGNKCPRPICDGNGMLESGITMT
ncbi:hypothetical protein B0J14DRAFT_131088 [Halenospora varia]|nr:hypothetical protein B0J14DRAFT_131088 [Halenospora varia]